ncbi:transmembrane protein 244 [Panthera uncia]|uniref:transmembrane protein 244 n=1 Tax=Panthera uncia TaxID=29064 RepID=UPI0020FFE358|nr:transmembrane protein 244 [Panthera uncia]
MLASCELEGGGRTVKVSSRLRRHFETAKRSKPLHTIFTEFYSGQLTDRGDQKSPGSWTSRLCSPQVVLQNLLICVILFYTVYYAVLGMCCMMLKVYELDVLAPFDFKTNPSWLNTNYKVLLISTQVTYLVCGLLFVLVVEEWVWDYAISVTILHVAITSTVMLEFPLTSHWWAALGSGLISMICGGQAFAYCLFKDNFIYPDLDEF